MGDLRNRVYFKFNKTSAIFLILFCSILISFNGLAIRNINNADALLINVYRSVALMSSVSIFLLITTKKPLFRHITAIGWPGIFGGILMGCANIFFLQALTNTTVANALFTISAIPFITAFLAFLFLQEKLELITLLELGQWSNVWKYYGVTNGSRIFMFCNYCEKISSNRYDSNATFS